jgi:hypothetical protein
MFIHSLLSCDVVQAMTDRDSLLAAVARQGALVREMKKNGGVATEITAAVVVLNDLKAQLSALSIEPNVVTVNKKGDAHNIQCSCIIPRE